MKTVILITADGYEINTSISNSLTAARQSMRKEWNERNRNDPDSEWASMSYVNDDNAILYDNGEDVYLWKIIAVSND